MFSVRFQVFESVGQMRSGNDLDLEQNTISDARPKSLTISEGLASNEKPHKFSKDSGSSVPSPPASGATFTPSRQSIAPLSEYSDKLVEAPHDAATSATGTSLTMAAILEVP